jgi:hypothetical protein
MSRPAARFLRIRKAIALWLPIAASLIALCFTWLSYRQAAKESQLQLWNALRHEFDREMLKERRAAGRAYGTPEFQQAYQPVMDFFETLGFLVRTRRLDADLFDDTWGFYFSGYFQGAQVFMDADRKQDSRTYGDVYDLARKFGHDPTLQSPVDLKRFYDAERNLPE